MTSSAEPLPRLALRLRALRAEGLAGRPITQGQLAQALSTSVPLISSWESTRKPTVPMPRRLEDYATFFATERSVAGQPFRLLQVSELNPEERARRDELLRELIDLRDGAAMPAVESAWQFPEQQDVTIMCSELPYELRQAMPYADPDNPDYVKLYRLADLDALIELYGHIRAVNPTNWINMGTLSERVNHLYTAHLVLLGGVDWNVVTRDLLERIDIPVRQLFRQSPSDVGGFEVNDGEKSALFRPILRKQHTHEELIEDVAHFYRGPNPLNTERTLTICNGSFARGTLGAVRSLTDPRFRDRNEGYVRDRFSGLERFSIISRVYIVSGEAVTPDWTSSDVRLHEWPARED